MSVEDGSRMSPDILERRTVPLAERIEHLNIAAENRNRRQEDLVRRLAHREDANQIAKVWMDLKLAQDVLDRLFEQEIDSLP